MPTQYSSPDSSDFGRERKKGKRGSYGRLLNYQQVADQLGFLRNGNLIFETGKIKTRSSVLEPSGNLSKVSGVSYFVC